MNINQTNICLIPKVDQQQVVSQFRPLLLCYAIYIMVSKVVVNRLKLVFLNLSLRMEKHP